jgi:hypothetical protein
MKQKQNVKKQTLNAHEKAVIAKLTEFTVKARAHGINLVILNDEASGCMKNIIYLRPDAPGLTELVFPVD